MTVCYHGILISHVKFFKSLSCSSSELKHVNRLHGKSCDVTMVDEIKMYTMAESHLYEEGFWCVGTVFTASNYVHHSTNSYCAT